MPFRAIAIDTIIPALKADTQESAYRAICEKAAETKEIDTNSCMKRIMEKEAQNANSLVGGGVAIPFTRSLHIQKPYSVLARLETPLACNTPDGMDIDLICLVLFPRTGTMHHLTQLARLSRALKEPSLRQKIRETQSVDTIRSLLIDPDGWMMAA